MESFRRSFFAVLKYYSAIFGGNFSSSVGQLKKINYRHGICGRSFYRRREISVFGLNLAENYLDMG